MEGEILHPSTKLLHYVEDKAECHKMFTWILGSESDGSPALIRDGNGVLERRINKIIVLRIFFLVKIPKAPTNNIETESMEMHWMVSSSNYIGSLEDKLNCSSIFQHSNFSPSGRYLIHKRISMVGSTKDMLFILEASLVPLGPSQLLLAQGNALTETVKNSFAVTFMGTSTGCSLLARLLNLPVREWRMELCSFHCTEQWRLWLCCQRGDLECSQELWRPCSKGLEAGLLQEERLWFGLERLQCSLRSTVPSVDITVRLWPATPKNRISWSTAFTILSRYVLP
ncbi:hypothetical protein V2J09_023254 [Rumex salicifolius]